MNKTFNCWAKQLKVLEIGDEKTTHSIQIMTLCTASTAPTVHDCKNAALSLPPAASTTSHCTKPFMQFHYYYYSLSREESSNIFFPTIPPPFSEPSCIISHSAEDDDHPTSEAFRKRQATSTSYCRTEEDFSKLPILSLLPSSSLLTERTLTTRDPLLDIIITEKWHFIVIVVITADLLLHLHLFLDGWESRANQFAHLLLQNRLSLATAPSLFH